MEPVRRGGRERESAEQRAQADLMRREREAAIRASDTRILLSTPHFRRWLAYWLRHGNALTVLHPTTAHDALRAELGKQYFAMEMLADVQAIDPSFVTELWATPQTEQDANA